MDLAGLISCYLIDYLPDNIVEKMGDNEDWFTNWENQVRKILNKLKLNKQFDDEGRPIDGSETANN